MNESKLTEMILLLKENHENIRKQLRTALNENYDIKIINDKGKEVALSKKDLKGFRIGIIAALTVIGEFPVEITKSE